MKPFGGKTARLPMSCAISATNVHVVVVMTEPPYDFCPLSKRMIPIPEPCLVQNEKKTFAVPRRNRTPKLSYSSRALIVSRLCEEMFYQGHL